MNNTTSSLPMYDSMHSRVCSLSAMPFSFALERSAAVKRIRQPNSTRGLLLPSPNPIPIPKNLFLRIRGRVTGWQSVSFGIGTGFGLGLGVEWMLCTLSSMPELPDVTIYLEALRPRVVGQPLEAVRLASPFVLRSVDPPIAELVGRPVADVRRLGKRLVLDVGDDLYAVIPLMIAGRLR